MLSVTGDKYLKIMCDYTAEGVWTRRGATSPYLLPLSDELREKLVDWNGIFDIGLEESGLTWEQFNAMGLDLAKQVKKELPDWTIYFYDEMAYPGDEEAEKIDGQPWVYEIIED